MPQGDSARTPDLIRSAFVEDASPAPPGPDPAPAIRARLRACTLVVAAALAVAALGISTGVVVLRPAARPSAVAQEATKPPRPLTPFEHSANTLVAQAAALVDGDEKAWLAAVDPANRQLRARYRMMFRSLRALEVSNLEYHPYPRDGAKPGSVAVGAHLAYCFSVAACPQWRRDSAEGPPRITQTLTFKPVKGRYLITGVADAGGTDMQPTPWETGELVFARGARVTVAATRSQAKNLRRVLTIAEKAAVVNDRFAGYVGNPQRRYRVYLADEKAWKTWYGGIDAQWTVGYAVPLTTAGTDVVLRMSELLKNRELMATTIQHELGHVITVGGVTSRDAAEDRWLSEGIAEYIGWAPRPARASWNRYGARSAYRGGKEPKTIAAEPFGAKASDRTVDAFYAMGHFAADCMADRYGERRLFTFVRLVLREDRSYDKAARDAFGKPFATVDKACVKWIKGQV
jgi:hypothetical protein